MSHAFRPTAPAASRPWRQVPHALALVALLAFLSPSPGARAADDPAPADTSSDESGQGSAKKQGKAGKKDDEAGKPKKVKQQKLSKDQKRRFDIESGGRTATEWYQQAVQLYRAGRYLDTRSILLPLEDSARAIDIQEKVKLLIADTYFAQGGALNLAEALARYKSFATFFPTSEHGEYVQFQIGRSYFKQLGPSDRDQSYTDSVVAEYSKFLELYPKSQYADQARRERTEAIVLRARHEYKVAQFYWTWQDYRACSTRLRSVLKDFPELPEREKALWMCAQSLYNSGEREEGDSYAARLAADYPGSEYISRIDAGASGGRTIQAQLQRQDKSDKQADRTHRRQLNQDRKRTRQIRKDSGLPADVPGMTVSSPRSSSPAGTAPAVAPSPAPEGPSPDDAAQKAGKAAEKAAEEQARRDQAEKDEQARAEKKAADDARAETKRQEEADKAAAKEAERLAKQSPGQVAEQSKEEAKKAARRAEEVERLEAEEAAREAKRAEAQKKRDEEAAAEAAKKAAKKARKKS